MYTFDQDSDQAQPQVIHPPLEAALNEKNQQRYMSKTIQKGLFSHAANEEEFFQSGQSIPPTLSPSKADLTLSPSRRKRKERLQQITLQPVQHGQLTEVFVNVDRSTPMKPAQSPLPNPVKSPAQTAVNRAVQVPLQQHLTVFEEPSDDDEIQPEPEPEPNYKSKPQNQLQQFHSDSEEQGQNQTQPAAEGIISASHESSIDFTSQFSLKRSLLSPLHPSKVLRMEINRDNSGFNTFWPEYHLHFCGDSRYLMSAKKTSSKPTSTFIISCNRSNFEENVSCYLGKMKSNILGDVLNVYGPGFNPSNAKDRHENPRELLATIVFETSFFQAGKPREFMLYCLKPGYSYYKDFSQVRMYEDELSLKELFENKENIGKIALYHNRQPVWREDLGGYMLNFKGRVGRPSIKNFILESVEYQDREIILFGKVSDKKFNLDISGPLQPIVSFAVALSAFDSRIICE